MKNINKKINVSILWIMLIIASISTCFINVEAEDGYNIQDDDWYRKPGYTNCTYGVPDFDMHQDNWYSIGYRFIDQWYMDGPVALLDCLWWLDCKQHDLGGGDYFLPDLCGKGSKHPDNVQPLVEWISSFLNTTVPTPGVPMRSGTTAENFTSGTQDLLDYLNLSSALSIETSGYRPYWEMDPQLNYTNITRALDNCSDVIALLGFWFFNFTSAAWERIGGHYVQINGYNDTNMSLSFSDPFIDSAEEGNPGWYSPHTIPHDNTSHNDTNNVSYDYWNISPAFSGVNMFQVANYPVRSDRDPFEYWNWTYLNWWDDCPHDDSPLDSIYTEIEVAWFIQQDYSIEVNKTIWNGTWWTHWYNASVGENVMFNITVWNTGENITTNVTIWDTFYDALGWYIPGSSYITWPNGTRIQREPDAVYHENGTCMFPGHGHVEYDFCDDFDYWAPGETITIHFNVTVNNTNYSKNNATVYLCDESLCGPDCIGPGVVNASDECYINPQFNTSIICLDNCSSDASDWVVSEHVYRPCTQSECLDETWFEYETEFDRWYAYNTSTFLDKDWGWVYKYDDMDGLGTDDMNLSYTIANNSCANRSQNILRIRMNRTFEPDSIEDVYEPFAGIIYSYVNNSWYDMVLYGYVSELLGTDHPIVALVSKRDNTLINSEDGSVIDGPQHLINYWDENWSCNQTLNELSLETYPFGIWSKVIYNEYCGHLQVKAWNINDTLFDLCSEPSGWIYDGNLTESINDDAVCFGLVVWNPNASNFTVEFDFIEDWRLNYSYDGHANQSQIENHSSSFDKGIPLMEFNGIDFMDILNQPWQENCWTEWMEGNLTFQEFADCSACYNRNVSSLFGMTSRSVIVHNESCTESYTWDNQNDTIYYYTGVMKNSSEYYGVNNTLVIHIEDTSDGTYNQWDGAIVAIDVDNNMVWDDNDMCFSWYADMFGDTMYTVWNGTNIFDNRTLEQSYVLSIIDYINCTYGYSGQCIFPPLHRYAYHRVYELIVPLEYFEKSYVGSQCYLDAGDTFGINVMTAPYNLFTLGGPTDRAYPWSNWNETNCTNNYYVVPEDITMLAWDSFMNISTQGALLDFYQSIWNGTAPGHMENWGHGTIGTEEGPFFEYDVHANKTASISEITDITTYHLVNYTIRICNNGDNNVTNIVVYDTIPAGSTYNSSSLPAVNVTGSDLNWTFNVTDLLHHGGDCIEFNITLNFSANMAPNGTTVYNYINVTTLQGTITLNQSGVKYGENNPPVIKWQSPVNESTGVTLVLTNMSVGVGDIEGTFDVYFYTNKTDTWNDGWNAIGSNLTQTNGTFHCNQTFNNSQWYNTQWRWGGTTYYWFVNVSDGIMWVNESYSYTTWSSRYDVTSSGDVVSTDVSVDWTHRQGAAPYDGIYDVDGSGDVVSGDVSLIWLNRT